jgi:hypothetical protein
MWVLFQLSPKAHGSLTDNEPERSSYSHHVRIDDAPDSHSKFDEGIDGYTKVLIRFVENAAAAAD